MIWDGSLPASDTNGSHPDLVLAQLESYLNGETMLTPEMQRRIDEAARAQRGRLDAAPKLSADTITEYLDWITRNLDAMSTEQAAHRLHAAELVVRIHMGNAQAKATQHTLVEDGTIKPPPQAS